MGLPSFPRAQALFRVKRFTMTSPQMCRRLWNQCHQLLQSNVSGCFVECGVWKGGSAAIMGLALQHANQKRDLHLFDSFEGLPEPSEADGPSAAAYSSGQSSGKLSPIKRCEADLDEVQDFLFLKTRLNPAHVHFHVGWFQATVPAAAPRLRPIALLRLDGDWYESTRLCLEHLYPNVSPGGIIVMDDYWAWEGCRKATDEYRQTHQIITPIIRTGVGAGYWAKS